MANEAYAKDEKGRFQTGNIGGGRPKGARAKLGEAFIEAMQQDFAAHGVAAIEKVRDTKPDAYLKIIASILPQDLNINISPMDELTDDQLIERIRALDAVVRPFLDAQAEDGTDRGVGTATAH